jgi:hypothetical protein
LFHGFWLAGNGYFTFRFLFTYPVLVQLREARRHDLTHFSGEGGTVTDSESLGLIYRILGSARADAFFRGPQCPHRRDMLVFGKALVVVHLSDCGLSGSSGLQQPAQKHMICARQIRYREVPHLRTFTWPTAGLWAINYADS